MKRGMQLGLALLLASSHVPAASWGDLRIGAPLLQRLAQQPSAGRLLLTLRNQGQLPERLLGVSASWAGNIALQQQVGPQDAPHWQVVNEVLVPAQGQFSSLAPDWRLVLQDIPAADAAALPIRLHFARAGAIELQARVLAQPAKGLCS